MSGRVACTSSRSSLPNPFFLASYQRPLRPVRPGPPARTGQGSLASTGNALLDPRPCVLPGQPGKTPDGRLSAPLHFGNPRLAVARLDVRLEACQKLRRHTRALTFGELERLLEHLFRGRGHSESLPSWVNGGNPQAACSRRSSHTPVGRGTR